MKKQLPMIKQVQLYLNYRQKLGYKNPSLATGLSTFAECLDQSGYRGPLTIPLAIRWATASTKSNRLVWARRLNYLYGFAKFYKAIDPKTEIPPLNLYGSIYRRTPPYIYSKKEIYDLFEATKKLNPINGLKPVTFRYLLGLLASTGLRISEAIHLTREDVDLDNGILTIRETKYHKSRYVPLHKTTKKALNFYADFRDKKIPAPFGPEFFINDKGRAFCLQQTEKDFKRLREGLGWKTNIHLGSFRHTFACQRLLKWYKEGKSISEMITYLSVYLGHAQVTYTYWYLTATPELMSIASKKFEKCSTFLRRGTHE